MKALGSLTTCNSPDGQPGLSDPIAFPEEEYIDFEGTLLVVSYSRYV